MAILIIGIAIASLLAANIAFTSANGSAADLSTAEFLAEQVRELTAPLPVVDPQTQTATFGPEPNEATLADYDDLDDFDNFDSKPYSPIDAARNQLPAFSAFSQHVTVENVNAGNFEQVDVTHTSQFVRVTVTVSLNSKQLTSIRWIRARY